MNTTKTKTTMPRLAPAPLCALNIKSNQENMTARIEHAATTSLADFTVKARKELNDMRSGYSRNGDCLRELRRCKNLFTFQANEMPKDEHWLMYKDEFYRNRTEEQKNKVVDKTFKTLYNLMDAVPLDNIYALEKEIFCGMDNSVMVSALGYIDEPHVDREFRQEVYSKCFVEVWTYAMDMMLLTLPKDKLPAEDAEDYVELMPYLGRMYLFAIMKLNTCILHELTYAEFTKKSKKKENRSDLRAEMKKMKAAHESETEELNKKIEGLSAELAKANALAAELRKDHKASEHEIKRLEKELFKQKSKEKNSVEAVAIEETELEVESVEEQKELVIPESNRVWFVGGHPNLVNKMKAKHPEWRFVGLDNLKLINAYKAGTTQCTCVILFTAYVSHNINDVFVDNRPENCVLLHCNGPVNENRMMAELKEDWIMQGMPVIEG